MRANTLLRVALAALSGCAAGAASSAPRCIVSVEDLPSRATVGEQILYRVRILRREDIERVEWIAPLLFPDFRAEWLPGRAEDTRVPIEDATFVAREEQRAIFPARAGLFEIPSRAGEGRDAALRCTTPDGASEVVSVPRARIRVVEPPAEGRPANFSGVVGKVLVQTVADRAALRLGESVGVSILVRGAANLWDLDPPIAADDFAGGEEFFPRLPELDMEPGERLYVRRFFRFEIVPHGVGRLTIPQVRIPYYDPQSGRYDEARASAVEIAVEARARTASDSRSPRRDAPAALSDAPASHKVGLSIWLGGCSIVILIGLPAGLAWRRWSHASPLRAALAEADKAARLQDWQGEAGALVRALRAALAMAAPGLEELEPAQIRERAPAHPELAQAVEQAARLLAALERERFSRATPDRVGPGRDQVVETLQTLRALH